MHQRDWEVIQKALDEEFAEVREMNADLAATLDEPEAPQGLHRRGFKSFDEDEGFYYTSPSLDD